MHTIYTTGGNNEFILNFPTYLLQAITTWPTAVADMKNICYKP